MFSRTIVAGLCSALLLASSAFAASDGKYQFTGVVLSVDGDTITVKKNEKETWTFFAKDGDKPSAKVGDKVTVYYKMVVQSIEAKPAKKGK